MPKNQIIKSGEKAFTPKTRGIKNIECLQGIWKKYLTRVP